jgi:hypothetical protein
MQEIIQALSEEKCFLFAGSGICKDAGLPTWKELVSNTIIKLAEQNLLSDIEIQYCNSLISDTSKLPLIFDNLFGKVNRSEVLKIVRTLLQPKNESQTIKKLRCLNFKGIITTNYDKVVETIIDKYDIWRMNNSEEDFKNIDHVIGCNVPFAMKIHGDIDNISGPEEETVRNGGPFMVISKSDYSFLQSRLDNLQTCIHTLLVQGNLLFLGYGYKDPDIDFILSYLNKLIRFKNKSWFIGLQGSQQPSLPHNVELLTPIKNWDELPLWLEELRQGVEKKTKPKQDGYEISEIEREALHALAEYLYVIESDNVHIRTLSSIVAAELFGKERIHNSYIGDFIGKFLDVGKQWSDSYSDAVTENLVELGIIERDNDYIVVKQQMNFLYAKVQDKVKSEKNNFCKSIRHRLEEASIFVEDIFFETFSAALNDCCMEFGDSLAKWIHRGLSKDISEKMFLEIFEKYFSSNEEIRFAVDLTRFIFSTPNENEIPYLYRLLRASVLLNCIRLKPLASKFIKTTLGSYELYLDTNILLPLIIKEDRNHNWTLSIVKSSQKAGVKFYVLEDMIDEVDGNRNIASKFLKYQEHSIDNLIQYSIASGSSSNRFISGYIALRKNKDISSEAYLHQYNTIKIKDILRKLNINLIDAKIDKSDTTYIYVKSKIEEEWKQKPSGGNRNPVLNEHEANQFLYIYEQRNKKKREGLQDDVWFLSYETVLEHVYQTDPQR